LLLPPLFTCSFSYIQKVNTKKINTNTKNNTIQKINTKKTTTKAHTSHNFTSPYHWHSWEGFQNLQKPREIQTQRCHDYRQRWHGRTARRNSKPPYQKKKNSLGGYWIGRFRRPYTGLVGCPPSPSICPRFMSY
jgi:hypothetical protein